MQRFVALVGLTVASVVAGAAPPVAAAPRDSFAIERNSYLLGQAPDWLDARNVVFHDPFLRDDGSDGQIHIHRSTLDGRKRKCLTCGLEGPNQVPVVQPKGKWILFHSWNGHSIRLGRAEFGGVGSDVWVMTRDGKRRTNLTKSRVQRQLSRLLVARRSPHRLDGAQLERGRRRQRQVGCARCPFRARCARRPASGGGQRHEHPHTTPNVTWRPPLARWGEKSTLCFP